MKPAARTFLSAATIALLLSGCDLRRESGEEPQPVPTEESIEEPSPAPEPEETQTPTVSIIRDDASPEAEMEIPTPPLEVTVPFAEGGADLSERAERVLAGVLTSKALGEDWPVVLRGHTDSSGNDQANLRASRARAEAVAAWLVERGVDDDRIEVIAFGEQNPLDPNAMPDGSPNEQGRAKNRRVEVEIAPPDAFIQDEKTEDGETVETAEGA